MNELETLNDQYSEYETITEYIQLRTNKASQLYEKIKESERISSARINQQQLRELIDCTKVKTRQMLKELREESDAVKREPKVITERELYDSFFNQVDSIDSEEDLERAIESLKRNLIRELQTYYFVKS